FAVLAVAGQIERNHIREKTLEGQAIAASEGNRGGRPKVIDDDMLTLAVALEDKGIPVPEIAKKLTIKTGKNAGRSPSVASLHRALAEAEATAADDGLSLRPKPARIRRPEDPLTPEESDLRERLQAQPHRTPRCGRPAHGLRCRNPVTDPMITGLASTAVPQGRGRPGDGAPLSCRALRRPSSAEAPRGRAAVYSSSPRAVRTRRSVVTWVS
ncbi:hypothetical protein ACFWVE_20780, partial [Streptomyces sp. NPDC058632]